MNLLIFHNFVRNILTIYVSELLKRFQKTIAIFSISFTLSFSANTMNLKNNSQQNFQQFSQSRNVEDFAIQVLSASIQKLFDAQKEQIDKLLQMMKQQKEQMEELKSTLFNPGFSAGYMMGLAPFIADEVAVFCGLLRERVKRKKMFKLKDLILKLTVDVIDSVIL